MYPMMIIIGRIFYLWFMEIPLKKKIRKITCHHQKKDSASTDTATSKKLSLNSILRFSKNGTNKLQVPAMLVYYP